MNMVYHTHVLRSACLLELKPISYPVGNRFFHPTHSIVLYGGVFIFTACGANAVTKLAIVRALLPTKTWVHKLQPEGL